MFFLLRYKGSAFSWNLQILGRFLYFFKVCVKYELIKAKPLVVSPFLCTFVTDKEIRGKGKTLEYILLHAFILKISFKC